jgi:putative nucleotidyltransferase with HDIG domain
MRGLKSWLFSRFETFLVLAALAGTAVVNCFVLQKLAFLDFFYLPVLAAGYWLGRSKAIQTAVLCVLLIGLYVALDPARFEAAHLISGLVWWHTGTWAAFLLICAVLVGTLADQKQKQFRDLEDAYYGVLEILAKYLEAVDRYTKNHSVRVSELATGIAVELGLRDDEIEAVKVGALLHDIGKIEVSTDLIRKATQLTTDERDEMARHVEAGARMMGAVGSVLSDAIPMVLAHHEHFSSGQAAPGVDKAQIPVGARIIAVADAYDALVTDRPYRAGKPPWEAMREIQAGAGSQFDPKVVEAFLKALRSRGEERQVA